MRAYYQRVAVRYLSTEGELRASKSHGVIRTDGVGLASPYPLLVRIMLGRVPGSASVIPKET
jgi:hypothetical protein